jgi:stage II sporulation protein E
MALAYQNRYVGQTDSLAEAFMEAAKHIRLYSSSPKRLDREDYRDIVLDISERMCSECAGRSLCISEGIHPAVTNADRITEKLLQKKRILNTDVNTDTEFCQIAGIVAESINREISRIEQENYKKADCSDVAQEYEQIAEFIRYAGECDANERASDSCLNATLAEIIEKQGLKSGVIRVFGKRRRHFIIACEDADGKKIGSPKLRESIEETVGVKLGEPKFFRRGKMALMECGAVRKNKISFFTASKAGLTSEVSGDTAVCFDSRDDYFYSLISDGMGSGDLAHETSELTAGYIKRMLEFGTRGDALISLINGILKSRENECSATVDLFELDCLNGEASFLKCGAPPSYLKRGSSVFIVKSQTAPIGLMRSVDMERIKAKIEDGDYVIMFSDGVSDGAEDAPWLLELLCREPPENTEEYARSIIEAAPKTGGHRDDMSVTVIKVTSV